ncbi:ClpP/crotonase-like domain-containing protein [Suillus clintonianus]|uniref:ClpP/crotonase-like domain-containing protein n=1 Tax=Suillus clintonianus TaxID=1904413 RepID=UPI001B87075F|nr:ClpP/crotonase-like domain-containing protein [Suillus clintonianus]KAG2141069.1 ClpP/crotonase-like domain-containing protein [Suillus clintonianus]
MSSSNWDPLALHPPSYSDELQVSFPQEHVLLMTLNRPRHLNAMTPQLTTDIAAILNWFDDESSLWVVIVTGQGRAFCAGADLKAWLHNQTSGTANEGENVASSVHGFASISRRHSSCKPMIAAVNGSAYGGGVEMILNCDMVIASEDAVFALPEVKRGVLAAQGVIPRLGRVAGHQLASEMLLLGNTITAVQARDRFRFVNIVVEKSAVVPTALDIARQMTINSPDSVQSSKEGLILSQKHHFEDAVRTHSMSLVSKRLYHGANIKEGLAAFSEKRKPKWSNPAKL